MDSTKKESPGVHALSICTDFIINTKLITKSIPVFLVFLAKQRVATSGITYSLHTTYPTMDTEFNMVAKTVVPGASPPSTTAGSTGETVLNETAFDVSEIFETVNPVGPEARQIRVRLGGMACDELFNLLESNGADGGFLESVLSGGVTGAEFERMLASAGTAQEAVQRFNGITGIDSFKIMTLWSRTRAEPTDRQASGEEPRLPRYGPRPDRNSHTESNGCEEDEPEGRSEDSEGCILKSFGAHRGPKLELT